ncbi:GspH/FimT family pseudopilin [Sphaerotilus microaerophilus]|uniref:Type II secretion system protein H n=1 Tax=Sphaerotilus microaerophilus TaxID=2914710 RepID=A0ABN6PVF1_9BURK|nr:GspH/FimT family pseudopilin [Sphaerotilus sp. FB-5]BDI08053.1 hypothetical protein CATMQ487_50230 [Sphaerotilus sp. FB-5]
MRHLHLALPPPRAGSPARGLTLIELLVVMAILGLISAMAAPSMADFQRSRRLESTVQHLASDLSYARAEAIKRNTPVVLCATTTTTCGSATTASDWVAGWQICYDKDADGACDVGSSTDPNPIRRQTSLSADVTLTGPASRLRFNADGTLTATDYTAFTLAAASAARWWVAIAASGVVTVRKG